MTQYFPSDEIIASIIKIGAKVIRLPAGSNVRVGGLFYRSIPDLDMDITLSGSGGLDTGVVAPNTEYYMFIVDVAGTLGLVSSLSASSPTGFDSFRRIGQIETDASSDVTVVNSDAINDIQDSQIQTLQLQQSINTSDIGTLQTDVGNAQTDIGNLQSQQGTNTSDIGTLQTDVGNAQTDISNLQSQQSTNTGNISTNTGGISTNSGNIGTLQTDVGNLQSGQTTLQSQVGTNTSTIGTHTSQITGLQDEFSPTLGHRHDGADARKVLATDLDATGGSPGEFLYINGSGDPVWSTLPAGDADQPSIPIDWIDGLANSPTLQVYTNGTLTAHRYYPFAQAGAQKLYGSVRVVDDHADGQQIKMAVPVYTANSNATLSYKFDVTCYLVQPGDVATNLSKVSTATLTVPGVTTVDQATIMEFNITDASGLISGNTVSAGDILHIAIERATLVSDDVADTVKLMPNACQVRFNI
jgi:peptidoglycan hydrolase CwlO-like protein